MPAQELHDFDSRAPGLVVDAPSDHQWRPAVTRRHFDPHARRRPAADDIYTGGKKVGTVTTADEQQRVLKTSEEKWEKKREEKPAEKKKVDETVDELNRADNNV